MIDAGLAEALAAATGSARMDERHAVSGACINACDVVRRGAARWFVKRNDARFADAFAAEADGLAAIAAAGVRAPAPVAHGRGEYGAWLVMEWLPLAAPQAGSHAALGEALATLHAARRGQFGWHRDNFIGATPQDNSPHASWPAFWLECRLRPQLERAARNGHRLDTAAALDAAGTLLAHHAPAASLLHGDLWSGNAGFLEDGTPVVFDPAVYAGDAEADLAMTELFGGFPAGFFAAYRAAHAVDAGYCLRRDLYNLYHVLNHLNLFGAGYLGQARRLLARLAAEVR